MADLVLDLSLQIDEILDGIPDEVVLPALAEVVAIRCLMIDEDNPGALLDDIYNRAREINRAYCRGLEYLEIARGQIGRGGVDCD